MPTLDPILMRVREEKTKEAARASKKLIRQFLTNEMTDSERENFISMLEQLTSAEQVTWLLRIQLELHKMNIQSHGVKDFNRIQDIVNKHCQYD